MVGITGLRRSPPRAQGAEMRTFVWLLVSGVLWLLLIQLAPRLDVPPQLISMLRSVYLGSFSIFMMVEIRRKDAQETTKVPTLSLNTIVWYLVPVLSVLLLWWLSPKLQMTARLWIMMGGFYLLQLNVLAFRSARSGMRSGVWELLVPVVLLPLLLHDVVAMTSVVIGSALLLLLIILHRPTTKNGCEVADSLIMQLPSLCIAPVVLIVLRDVLGSTSILDRSKLELLGMVINGIGSALWTATVMRSVKLGIASVFLWGLGIIIALTLNFTPNAASATYVIGAMLLAEVLRGSLWLGLTQIMSHCDRWQGFAVNAIATVLPLMALLIAHHLLAAQDLILFYAACHVLVPLSLWALLWNRHTEAK